MPGRRRPEPAAVGSHGAIDMGGDRRTAAHDLDLAHGRKVGMLV